MTISEIIAFESNMTTILSRCKERIVEAVENAPPIEGVQVVSLKPPIVIVQSSCLIKGKNLSPETYIPSAQANAIWTVVAGIRTVGGLMQAIDDMVKSENVRIRFGSSSYSVSLNPNTIDALKRIMTMEIDTNAIIPSPSLTDDGQERAL